MQPYLAHPEAPTALPASGDQSLANLLEQVTCRLDAGDVVDVEELAREQPQHASRLRELMPTMKAMATWGRTPAWARDEGTRPGGGPPTTGVLGDFRILRELGRGGMGTVFEAEQISMGRRVALKVLPFAALAHDKALQRFRNEVRAVAALDHPNIVSVYSVGEERGIHYYAMQLVRGQSLADLILQRRTERSATASASRGVPAPGASGNEDPTIDSAVAGPPSTKRDEQARINTAVESRHDVERYRTAVRQGIQAAEALQHAHDQGVLHRDVKPGNLLLDAEGKLYVTDFGLARIQSDAGMTMTGDIVGTLRYMAPEQALAKRVVIDHRADVYSLGATLYELLTLAPAFGESDRSELLKQIAFEEPAPLRKVDRRVPAELETIVLKAMAKSPDERYQTAQQLADDLGAFSENRPITARPPVLWNRAAKWSRRHVGIVWTALAASVLISVLLVGATAIVADSRSAAIADRELAEGERNIAVAQRNEAHLNQYYAEIVTGQTDLENRNVARLQEKLVRHLPLPDEPDHRGWEWYYLFAHCRSEVRALYPSGGNAYAAWSPDGDLIATAGAVWQADSGQCIRLFTPSPCLSQVVAWSPDSQLLAWGVSSDDSAIYVWNRGTDAIQELRGHQQSIWGLAFSPDGKQIASGSLDNTFKIWDLATGAVVRTHAVDAPTSVAWSPDGELLAAYLSGGGALCVWDAANGNEVLLRNEESPQQGARIAWQPDGQRLAVNGTTKWYILDRPNWDVVVEHPRRFVRSRSVDGGVAWSPSGDQLAIADGNVIGIWDGAGEHLIKTLQGHANQVHSVSWNPDGSRLVSSDGQFELRVWDVRSPLQPPPIATGSAVAEMSWAADGAVLTTVAAADLKTSRWRTTDGARIEEQSPVIQDGDRTGLLSPDRRLRAHLSASDKRPSITVRDAQTGAVHAVWSTDDTFEPVRFAWSGDSTRLAIVVFRSAVELGIECWDVNTEQRISRWACQGFHTGDQNLFIPTWSPDGAYVAMVGFGDLGDNGTSIWSSHVHVIDVATGKRTLKRQFGNRPRFGGLIETLAWSPDGSRLAQGTTDGFIEIIGVSSEGPAVESKAHDAPIRALAWSQNGRRLASGAGDGAVKVLETQQGNELLTLRVADEGCFLLAWSPDDKRLAAVDDSGVVSVWDATRAYEFAANGRRRGELARLYYGHANKVVAAAKPRCLERVLDLAPRALDYRQLRGQALGRLGRYDAAAREFAAATPKQVELGLWMALTQAHALLGARDLDAYRKLHSSLADAVRNSDVANKRHYVAWLGALIPDATDDFEAHVDMLIDAMTDDEVEDDEGEPYATQLMDRDVGRLGAMLYRLGRHDEAYQTLTKLAAKLGEPKDLAGQYELAAAQYFLAMARHQLGHERPARQLFNQAANMARRLEIADASWMWEVELATLHREAAAMIGETADIESSFAGGR